MRAGGDRLEVSAPVRERADSLTRALESGTVRRVTLTPLILRHSASDVLERRRRLFSEWSVERQDFGYAVRFGRDLRPTPKTPSGRRVTGQFDLLEVGNHTCILASTLTREAEELGPALVAHRAYPLASRPFIRSQDLVRLIVRVAAQRQWEALCTDAMGYHRETGEFRRDMRFEPVADAFREMQEQGRDMHQVRVIFRTETGPRHVVTTLNRHGRATLYAGDVRLIASDFVLEAVQGSRARAKGLSVERSTRPTLQKAVRLKFAEGTFRHSGDCRLLCDAVRRGDGLNVTTVHLNPYLNAQVIDYLSGQAVAMLVLDGATVSLVPRSSRCEEIMDRLIATVFRFFGEADLGVEAVG